MTMSSSQTRSNAATASVSRSYSSTSSQTRSESKSVSPSLSVSKSNSATRSQTSSSSLTPSTSKSFSGSTSQTASTTRSITISRSAASTQTVSVSTSKTETSSPTMSVSNTRSPSQTKSFTATTSHTPSDTRSPSVSRSASKSFSSTVSVTRSETSSISQTKSDSRSPSLSMSQSKTMSQTASLSKSFSRTISATRSESVSASLSSSLSPSMSISITTTQSPVSPTRTQTQTGTQTATQTVTATKTATESATAIQMPSAAVTPSSSANAAPVTPVGVSMSFIVMGPQLTRAKVINATQLPLLRNGIACIAASGTSPTNVYVSSTLDLINSPYISVDVSSGYIGNTQPPASTACALANSNPTGQSLVAPVQYNPSTDSAILITNTINVQVPVSSARMLQTIDDDVNSMNWISPAALSQQVALVLQNLGSNLGAYNPAMTSASDGTYNGTALLQTASTSGFSPPSAVVLAQLGAWVKTLGRNVRITQMSTIVLTTPDTFNAMTVNDAMAAARIVLSPSPRPIANVVATSSNSGTVVGVVIGVLMLAGAGVAFVLVRRRRQRSQYKKSASKSAAVQYVNSDRRIYVNTNRTSLADTPAMSFRAPLPPPIVKSVTVTTTPSTRAVYTPMIFRGAEDIPGSGINPEVSPDTVIAVRQTNAMKYFAPTASASNILHKANSIRIAENIIEDSNGRRGFTSEIRAKPIVSASSVRRLPKIDSDSDTDAAVTPMRVDKEEEPIKHRHRKSSRNVSESQKEPIEKSSNVEPVNTITTETPVEETPRRKKKKSSRNVSESSAPEPVKVEEPVPEPVKVEEPLAEETPRKKKKSSRNVSESPAPEPVKVEEPAEEAPRRMKSSRNVSESVAPEPVKVEEPADEIPRRKKKSSRNVSESVAQEPVKVEEPAEEVPRRKKNSLRTISDS